MYEDYLQNRKRIAFEQREIALSLFKTCTLFYIRQGVWLGGFILQNWKMKSRLRNQFVNDETLNEFVVTVERKQVNNQESNQESNQGIVLKKK